VVLGSVALWGRTVEHTLGYRSEFAYPQRLRLVCPVCFWQRGRSVTRPRIVAIDRDGAAMPLCDEHRRTAEASGLALGRWTPGRDLESRLLAEYRVEILPFGTVPTDQEWAYRSPGGGPLTAGHRAPTSGG
jgi:hypothetical protein